MIGQGAHNGSSAEWSCQYGLHALGANVDLSSQSTATWTGQSSSAFGSGLDRTTLIKTVYRYGCRFERSRWLLHVYYAGWENTTGNASGSGTADSTFTTSFNMLDWVNKFDSSVTLMEMVFQRYWRRHLETMAL